MTVEKWFQETDVNPSRTGALLPLRIVWGSADNRSEPRSTHGTDRSAAVARPTAILFFDVT